MGEIERREAAGVELDRVTAPEQRTPEQRLASERVIINAPMSFAGAAQRAWRIGEDMTGARRIALVALVIVPIIIVWWSTVIGWYVIFGILLVPYRLLRRGARKRKSEALRHREMLGAIDKSKDD
jgi:Flp pilus assembly protein TadB